MIKNKYKINSLVSGDPCHHYSNVRGQCTHLRRCQVALQGLRKNIKPQTCGFDRNEPVVCCPHSANIITPPHPGGGTPPPPPPRPITIRLPTTPITTTAVPKSAPLKKSAQCKFLQRKNIFNIFLIQ